MSDWHQFLEQQGALFPDGNPQHSGASSFGASSFGESPADYPQLLKQTLLFDLSNLTALRITGKGAIQLLQGQVTCDLRELSPQHSLIGALCTPKGRAIASFRVVKTSDEEVSLLMPANQVDSVQQSLAKYAPFFKVTLTPETGSIQVLGLAGENADTLCEQLLGSSPVETHSCVHSDSGSAIRLSDERLLLLVPGQKAQESWTHVAQQATLAGTPLWALLDIRAGVADIVFDTREMFIPQMINLQATGGISFKKGCYTGQEVIARMRYLGKLKRRMYRLQISDCTSPVAGTPCFIPGKKQSIGNVVSAARADHEYVELLVVLTEEAAESAQLQLGESVPLLVELLSLPYSLESH